MGKFVFCNILGMFVGLCFGLFFGLIISLTDGVPLAVDRAGAIFFVSGSVGSVLGTVVIGAFFAANAPKEKRSNDRLVSLNRPTH